MKDDENKIIASQLTAAFYAGLERRIPYFGEERRAIPNSPLEDDRIPSLSIEEVFHVYRRFIGLLEAGEKAGSSRE
jgi:hypothetical protein